jgi:protein involved in polysaccharide export with SLBB domain
VRAQALGPEYTISPGDVLSILIFGEPDLSKDYPVGPAGTLDFPYVGVITVADLTLSQAQTLLAEKLKSVFRAPGVEIGLNDAASNRKVYILGYVNVQGPVLLPFNASVVDALAAGGVTDFSDLRVVQLTHPGQAAITLDLSGLRTGSPIPVREKVRYGDVIYVPHLEDRIAVLGLVKTPGSNVLPLGQTVTVLDAIARIGGGLLQDAAPGQGLLVHPAGEVTPINLAALLQHGDSSQNIQLHAGDTLVVQQSEDISVVGEVTKPTTLTNVGTITVLEGLAQAGGFLLTADLAKARIVSAGGQSRNVDIKALWEQGDLSQNLKLNPGDVLLLPKMAPQNLLIVGSVQKPGVIDLTDQKQKDILRMIEMAGELPQSDITKVHVFRGDQALTINVDAVEHGDLKQNIQLQADDIVMVPMRDSVYLFGDLVKQGAVPWDSTLKLFDAISQAGGLGPRANENGTVLVRTTPGPVCKTTVTKIPMAKLGTAQCPQNIPLEAGDIIYVPTLPQQGLLLQDLSSVLWAAQSLSDIR